MHAPMPAERDQAALAGVEVKPESLPALAGDDKRFLESLEGADQDLAGAPAAPGQAPAAPPLPLERELAGMFAMMGAGAGHFLPSVKTALNDEACKQLGDVLAPVARKYGLEQYLAGFAWRVELQAVMVVVPIALAVKAAVHHDLAELARRQAEAEGGRNLHPAGAVSPVYLQPAAAVSAPVGMLQPIAPPPIAELAPA
jgi:hypothetical protein